MNKLIDFVLKNRLLITVAGLVTVNEATVIDLADATVFTVTLLNNVITIDDAGCSSDHVIVLVVGV